MNQRGITIVELLVTIIVTGIVVAAFSVFFTGTLVNYALANARSDLLGETQLALDVVNNDIRLSASADSQNRWEDEHAPGAPGDLFSWHSGAETLVLATAAEDANGNILFADPSEYISHKNNVIYFVENNRLYKRVLAAPVEDNNATTTCPASEASASCPADRILLRNVADFTIRYLNNSNQEVSPSDARAIEISVESATEKYGRDVSVNYETRMVFRND